MKVRAETGLIGGLIKDEIVLAKLSWQLSGNKSWNRDLLSFRYRFYTLLSLLNSSSSREAEGAGARPCLLAVLVSTCIESCDIYELAAA